MLEVLLDSIMCVQGKSPEDLSRSSVSEYLDVCPKLRLNISYRSYCEPAS